MASSFGFRLFSLLRLRSNCFSLALIASDNADILSGTIFQTGRAGKLSQLISRDSAAGPRTFAAQGTIDLEVVALVPDLIQCFALAWLRSERCPSGAA